ncbi:Calcium-dependent protein kinase 14 [Trifolium repens]|nr:Calcium-dependent protein kinase 14 [Trifolium repens]
MKTVVVLREPTGREIGLRYELGRELWRVESGITYLCKDRQTGEKLACKSISKNKLRNAIDIEDVRREVHIMRHLPTHPNIVTLKDTYEDDDDVHLVMELCQGGNLLHHIVAGARHTESSAAYVIETVVKVVQMCHKHGVMLRNLKLENLLFANKTDIAPLKVADFHSSISFQPGERLNQIIGSPYYMAPEVLKRNYGPEIDIWSAGVILYILLCGLPPLWADLDPPQQICLLKSLLQEINETGQGITESIIESVIDFKREPWPNVSDNAKDLVKKMLDPDPKCRLTAQEVLAHPWLIKYVKKSKQDRIFIRPDAHEWKRLNAPNLVMKMLTAHEELGHPSLLNAKIAPNVSSGETIRVKLLQYSVMNHLTKTTFMLITEHLSAIEYVLQSERSWVRDLGCGFSRIDDNEVRVRLQKLGQRRIPDVDVKRLVKAYFDATGIQGYIDYGKIPAILIQLRKISHVEHVNGAFHFFDRNQSGYIELQELRKALADEINTNNKQVINAIMHCVNTNKDGRISYEEITNRSFKLMKEWSSELIND